MLLVVLPQSDQISSEVCLHIFSFTGNRITTPSPTSIDGTTQSRTESPARSTSSVNTQDAASDKPGNGGVAGPSTG